MERLSKSVKRSADKDGGWKLVKAKGPIVELPHGEIRIKGERHFGFPPGALVNPINQPVS